MSEHATEHSHDSIAGNLKTKAGPVPLWAWGVGIGGLLVAYMWYKNKNSAATTTAATTTASTVAASTDPGTVTGAVTDPTQATSSALSSNQTWEAQALSQLTNGGASPLAAQAALENYLSGANLSGTDQTLVNQALGTLGLPPEGVSGPVNTTKPTPEVVVADQADLTQALQAGIPSSWLRAAPSDPKSGLANIDPTYAPPTGLPSAQNPLTALWLGTAGTIAPNGAPTAVGANRTATGQLAAQWYALQQKAAA